MKRGGHRPPQLTADLEPAASPPGFRLRAARVGAVPAEVQLVHQLRDERQRSYTDHHVDHVRGRSTAEDLLDRVPVEEGVDRPVQSNEHHEQERQRLEALDHFHSRASLVHEVVTVTTNYPGNWGWLLGAGRLLRRRRYSHSIVLGGFEEMSRATRFTCGISLMIRPETVSSSSYGSRAQSAVIASSEVT